MSINGAHGQRTIISHRADGSKVVSTGAHSGYVERSVVMNNRTYVQRTTVINQRVYTAPLWQTALGVVLAFCSARFLRSWDSTAGLTIPGLRPSASPGDGLVHPGTLGPNPYFVASPLYPSAAFWLTDYMIGDTLATAYQLNNDAAKFDDDGGATDSAAATWLPTMTPRQAPASQKPFRPT